MMRKSSSIESQSTVKKQIEPKFIRENMLGRGEGIEEGSGSTLKGGGMGGGQDIAIQEEDSPCTDPDLVSLLHTLPAETPVGVEGEQRESGLGGGHSSFHNTVTFRADIPSAQRIASSKVGETKTIYTFGKSIDRSDHGRRRDSTLSPPTLPQHPPILSLPPDKLSDRVINNGGGMGNRKQNSVHVNSGNRGEGGEDGQVVSD